MSAFMTWLDNLPAVAAIGGLCLGLVLVKIWEWRASRRGERA